MTSLHPLLRFYNPALLRQALTHRSYSNENPGEQHNERLEFLGDAILNFLSGDYLYCRDAQMGEDEMTRRRAALVDESQLAKFALEIGLSDRLRLGKGVVQEGGNHNPNLLSSALEAVIGAYYLDRDRDITAVQPLVAALFESVPEGVVVSRSNLDVKNQFQQWVQLNRSTKPPEYITEKIGGMDHSPEFISRVWVEQQVYGEGRGRSKKEAEKNAAMDALSKLNQQ